jgi:hypothetical protein
MDEGRVAYLKQLSSTNTNGGGWFVAADSAYRENGTIAYSHPTAAKQWVRTDYLQNKIINVYWTGARGDSTTDDRAAIQLAIDEINRIGQGAVYIPENYFRLDSTLWIKSNVHLKGAGKYATVLVGDSIGQFIRGADQSNFEISDLQIYHETYPDDQTISWDGDYYQGQSGVFLKSCEYFTIDNIYVIGTTQYGIFIGGETSVNSKHYTISNSRFFKASYRNNVIGCSGIESGFPAWDSTDAQNIRIINNTLWRGGAQAIINPGTSDASGLCGAISVDNVRNFVIEDNYSFMSGAAGVRVENSKAGRVVNNDIIEPAAGGIIMYSKSNDNTISGNFIKSFGRLPESRFIRHNGSGDTLITRVWLSDVASGALSLPTTISNGDSGWLTYPYVIGGTLDSIPAWDTTGITFFNPFRGYAGIATTSNCLRNSITGNHIIGDTTTTRGKYNYASDYGIMIDVHPVNQWTLSGGDHTILGNSVETVINSTQEIYAPQFQDSLTTPSYTKGITTRSNIFNNNATVWDWAIKDVLAHGLASQSGNNNIRILDDDLNIVTALENEVDQVSAFLGLSPWIFADGFNRTDADSLGTPKFSSIDSVWIAELDTMNIVSKTATSSNSTASRSSIAIADSDFVCELDLQNAWLAGRTAWFYWAYTDNNNWVGFQMRSDSTVRFMYNDAGGGATIISTGSNPSYMVTANDHITFTKNDTFYTVEISNVNGTHTALDAAGASYQSNTMRIAIGSEDPNQTFDNVIVKPYE